MDGCDGHHVGGRRLWRGYAVVFVGAALLYVATSAPSLVWQDSGLIQWRVLNRDIEGNMGLALSHPLYYLIAIGASFLGDPARMATLTTALISAWAVANLFLLMGLWVKRTLPAAIAALTLALSHTFWWHATVPETYNLTAALLLAELVVLLQYGNTGRVRYLYILALLNGLGVANHMLAAISFVCYAVLLASLLMHGQIRMRDVGVMAAFWGVGALPLEVLFVMRWVQTGDLGGTIASALFGDRWRADVLNASITARIVVENLMWIGLNLATPNVFLLILGAWIVALQVRRCRFHRVVAALVVLYLAFAFRYTVVDRYAFFIPFYCMAAILVGIGAWEMLERFSGRALPVVLVFFAFWTIPAYVAAPMLARELGLAERPRQLPYRDDAVYHLRPWRPGDDGAARFADEALGNTARDGIILADATAAPPLLYTQKARDKRPDVKVVSSVGSSDGAPQITPEIIDEIAATRTVYVVTPAPGYCPEYVLDRYEFAADGLLYRAVPRDGL
ncbi:MAG TPA: DUF2723 domain-containing protein [Phycisphaerales bacterium]|nr:DUF2723 domain-containing protein [Phycisphaerales bacterium]